MKLSIGLRLFIAVLMSIVMVALAASFLMREKVSNSFSDYALKIELDRLQEVSEALEKQYAVHNDWSFLPTDAQQRRAWISSELLRLYETRSAATPAAVNSRGAERATTLSPNAIPLPPLPPPLPPLPPLPKAPAPPELPNTVNSNQHPIQNDIHTAQSSAKEKVVLPDLFSRISILDKNKSYLVGRVPDNLPNAARAMMLKGAVIGYVRVTKSNLPSDVMAQEFLQEQSDTIVIIVILSVILSAIAASILTIHFRDPIQKLVTGSRLLAKGQFDTRLSAERSDELGELAQSFNQLAKKLELAEESRRLWVADTSHELRTPITVLRAQLEAIQDGVRPNSPENIALMLRQVLSLNKLIDELYLLARSDVGTLDYQMQRIDLVLIVEEEINNFQEKLTNAALSLTFDGSKDTLYIRGDGDRMRQVVINLLENCVRYTNAGGQVHIHAESQQGKLILVIDDSMPAVPDDALARLSERFYRVDASRNRQQGGAGLGLALCVKIIEAHGGTMAFSHSPLGGLRVTLWLPLEQG